MTYYTSAEVFVGNRRGAAIFRITTRSGSWLTIIQPRRSDRGLRRDHDIVPVFEQDLLFAITSAQVARSAHAPRVDFRFKALVVLRQFHPAIVPVIRAVALTALRCAGQRAQVIPSCYDG